MFIDTHAHLTDEAFKDDVENVIKKCEDCGVEKIITSSFDLSSSIEVVEFAKEHDNVYCSIGIYPEYAESFNDDVEMKLKGLAKSSKVVAIGEIGLQYTGGCPDRELQKKVFIKQIEMAKELGKPIVIHCRDAYGDAVALLKENKHLLVESGAFHCYNGSGELAKEIVKLGLYISVGGVSTFKNAENIRETLKNVPIDRILLETDCPYLTPHPYRGKRNDPSYIPTIAENLAKVKDVSVEEVARITTENARRLFKI